MTIAHGGAVGSIRMPARNGFSRTSFVAAGDSSVMLIAMREE
jgi:hypothetical protein